MTRGGWHSQGRVILVARTSTPPEMDPVEVSVEYRIWSSASRNPFPEIDLRKTSPFGARINGSHRSAWDSFGESSLRNAFHLG